MDIRKVIEKCKPFARFFPLRLWRHVWQDLYMDIGAGL